MDKFEWVRILRSPEEGAGGAEPAAGLNWAGAVALVRLYRELVAKNGMTDIKAFLLDKAAIEALLHQDGKELDGIRLYMGYSPQDGQLHLLPVGCEFDPATGQFNDYKVPRSLPAENSLSTDIEEPRPCPPQCSDRNILNE